MISREKIIVIGGGLAGCEAAWQATKRGYQVVLFEMKPGVFSPAHHNPDLAELVCSNSLKSNSLENASGLLKEEMRVLDSLIVAKAHENKLPAGDALAVDRDKFSSAITKTIESIPSVTLVRKEIKEIPDQGVVIIATGPLTSDLLSSSIQKLIGKDFLHFHDAVAPVIETDSINTEKVFKASRYNKGTDDYINCPMNEFEYRSFIQALLASEKTPLRDFETLIPYEGCMPIEVMAERGPETLAYGPMKPVGLIDPRTGRQPYAVVQLRQENHEATLYNMVGFQTRLKWSEQKKIFSAIPGLERARFARFGSIHRNTYINSPDLLLKSLQMIKLPGIFFAGQITGVEGYMESAAMGIVAGIQACCFAEGRSPVSPPPTTVIGGLLSYITGTFVKDFQPMNANFGILSPIENKVPKKMRKKLMAERALNDIREWKDRINV